VFVNIFEGNFVWFVSELRVDGGGFIQ